MPQKSVRNAAAIQSSEQVFLKTFQVLKRLYCQLSTREREKSPFPLFSPDANNTYF